jgi:hypothetical protein
MRPACRQPPAHQPTAPRPGRARGLLLAALLACTVAACGGATRNVTVYPSEDFAADETFARLFDASAEATCEAARRALLSQGYLLTAVKPDAVSASKNFQPQADVHVQIVFNVVCTSEAGHEELSTAYVSAIEDRYTLKKNPNSASVGVAAIGSLSIPVGANEDSLVKVASETIPAGPFYDRFFALMHRNLAQQAGGQ